MVEKNLALATVKATGFPTKRSLGNRFSDVKNVMDFGAVGDGVTDDRAFIQAAVDYQTAPYTNASRGTIFFPARTYAISGPITFEATAGIRNIGFLGAPGAKLLGGFADAMLKRSPDSPYSGVGFVENMILENNHASAKGIMFHSFVGGKIVNCALSGMKIGIDTLNSQSVTIDSCSLISDKSTVLGCIGILAGNGTAVISCDVSGFNHGIRHCNTGLLVHGGRYEVNEVGIVIGADDNNNALESSSFSILGPSMESNLIAIYCRAAAGGTISFKSGGAISELTAGLWLNSAQDVHVAGSVISSALGFSNAGVVIAGATRLSMSSVLSPSWNISGSLDSFELSQCNVNLTVSQLPTSARPGTILPVSNATATTVGSTVVGGGANIVAVVWSAGVWRII